MTQMESLTVPRKQQKNIGDAPSDTLALVLDEDALSREEIARYLDSRDWDVLSADSLDIFKDFTESQFVSVRMLVVSTELPGLSDAQEYVKRVFRYFPMIPVLLVGPEREDLTENRAEGRLFFGRLERPVSPEALKRIVCEMESYGRSFKRVLERRLFRGQVRSLEEPIARIIHDLNNQITGLKGGIDLMSYSVDMMQDPESQYKLKRYMEQFIQPSLEQIEQMVRNWRRIREARLRSPRSVDVSPLVVHAIHICANSRQLDRISCRIQGQPYSLQSESPPPSILALANTEQFVLAVALVIQNALEAIDSVESGCVEVELRETKDGMCSVRVYDNGSGIPDEDRTHIWRSFYTTKDGPRTGLGLSIAKQVIDKVQGQITCIESPLGGAGLEILVPTAGAGDDAPVDVESKLIG